LPVSFPVQIIVLYRIVSYYSCEIQCVDRR